MCVVCGGVSGVHAPVDALRTGLWPAIPPAPAPAGDPATAASETFPLLPAATWFGSGDE